MLPYRVMLPVPSHQHNVEAARQDLADSISDHFKGLLQLTISSDKKWGTWKLMTEDYYFILSPALRSMFQLWSDVLTASDKVIKNIAAFFRFDIPSDPNEVYIIIVPVATEHVVYNTFILKKKNEGMNAKELLARFEKLVPHNIAKLTLNNINQFRLTKLHDDNKLFILNEALREAFTFICAGMYRKGHQQFLAYDFSDVKGEWACGTLTLKETPTFERIHQRTIVIPPHSFEKEDEAMTFLNAKINDARINFQCNATHHVVLTISNKNLKVILDNNLHDIFGFDDNVFNGSKTYTAGRTFSLTRCIQFFYIYSNISDFVRIGNTESPLLAVVPFVNDEKYSLLKEKVFKTPMYIRVLGDHISQIDIEIYDGAGQLVPFVHDAVTTLRLHFRQI